MSSKATHRQGNSGRRWNGAGKALQARKGRLVGGAGRAGRCGSGADSGEALQRRTSAGHDGDAAAPVAELEARRPWGTAGGMTRPVMVCGSRPWRAAARTRCGCRNRMGRGANTRMRGIGHGVRGHGYHARATEALRRLTALRFGARHGQTDARARQQGSEAGEAARRAKLGRLRSAAVEENAAKAGAGARQQRGQGLGGACELGDSASAVRPSGLLKKQGRRQQQQLGRPACMPGRGNSGAATNKDRETRQTEID